MEYMLMTRPRMATGAWAWMPETTRLMTMPPVMPTQASVAADSATLVIWLSDANTR